MTAHPETESSTRSASSPVLAWKVGHHANSPQPINVKSPSIYGHHIDSHHFQHPSSDQSSGRPHFHPGAQKSGPVLNLAARRRQSRYDPMGRDEELDEEGYGELGHRHPLRRVAEEDAKEDGSVSLPGIKSLFGVAGEHPPTPSSAAMYTSSSLPSLVPNSPSSSPSTARTSRYSSLSSQYFSTSETHHGVPNVGGWWAPDFEQATSSTSSPRGVYRANSYPNVHPFIDEHADKRRRSDGPPALRDAEESARLRWQAQSRNASYPSTGPSPTPPIQGNPLRSLLHPPPASSMMSRGSVSGSSGFNTPLSLFKEHPGTPDEYPFDRKIAPVPSRSASLVGGQLAQSFADLTASERADRKSPLPGGMAPPLLPDRRPSAYHPISDSSPRPSLPPLGIPRPSSTAPNSRASSIGPSDARRQSVTHPSSPDGQAPPRRSSLTEAIMAKSGDDVAMASRRYGGNTPQLTQEQPQRPTPALNKPLITGWPPVRSIPQESPVSSPQMISLDSDSEQKPSKRGKKRGQPREDEDEEIDGDPGMRGMEVLAESARRVQEAERDHDESDSPPRGPNMNGQLQGTVIMGQGGAGPKYACAFCPKTFSRPSSLRIHTYSHTGERPFVCKEPSCRRRFSVQSNLKRHAKVHQLGGQPGGPSLNQLGPPHPHNAGVNRPIERSHRHPVPSHPAPQGYYHPHQGQNHMGHPVQGHPHQNMVYSSHPPIEYSHESQGTHPRVSAPIGERRNSQQGGEDDWEDEEDELEEDELDEEEEEKR